MTDCGRSLQCRLRNSSREPGIWPKTGPRKPKKVQGIWIGKSGRFRVRSHNNISNYINLKK